MYMLFFVCSKLFFSLVPELKLCFNSIDYKDCSCLYKPYIEVQCIDNRSLCIWVKYVYVFIHVLYAVFDGAYYGMALSVRPSINFFLFWPVTFLKS